MERNNTQLISWSHDYPDTQAHKESTQSVKKQMSLISIDTKLLNKILGELKSKSRRCSKKYHPRDSGIVEHMKIRNYNLQYKKKTEKIHDHLKTERRKETSQKPGIRHICSLRMYSI